MEWSVFARTARNTHSKRYVAEWRYSNDKERNRLTFSQVGRDLLPNNVNLLFEFHQYERSYCFEEGKSLAHANINYLFRVAVTVIYSFRITATISSLFNFLT